MREKKRTVLSENIERDCYVMSLSGRDSGRIHIVISCSVDGYVYIVDGKCRTVGKPKKKKCRHLRRVDLPRYSGELSDAAVAAAVKAAADVPDL